MRGRAFVSAGLVLTLVSCTPADPSAGVQDDEVAIRALIARTGAANNAADTLGWVDLFEPGAVYMPPGTAPVSTRAGLEEMAAAGFGPYAAAITIDPTEILVSGDWAFARSEVTGTVTPRTGGDPVPVNVKQLVVYHRQPNGEWKISRFMSNSNE
jgi:uncharacterized protein (TIGR02246 family)